MQKIRVLPDILASQVAAGEVVERPASVIKELVENSLDAGAQEIRVDVDRGGVALMRVIDDGCGMSREDALLSLERHATSKLRSVGDLAAISTLGFRGEAVPSIASVSRFRMITRERDAISGTEIVIEGGTMRSVREAGCAPGTTIEVKSLFYNMPARLKFLRAESTEAAHIEHQMRLHALAAPNVRFRLRRDDREVFDLPSCAHALDRLRQLLGTELARDLVEIPLTQIDRIAVFGYLLPPTHARKGRRHQCVFLNGRPVEDAGIARSLADGFRGALADGFYPAAWVWLKVPPTHVDVNVHPAKREVRFHRPHEIREVMLEAVARGLRPEQPQPSPTPQKASNLTDHSVPMWSVPAQRLVAPPRDISLPTLEQAEKPCAALQPQVTPSPQFRFVGMLHQRFALLEGADELVIFDPKAAHERIIYEEMVAASAAHSSSQRLLVPILLELEPRDYELILRHRLNLQECGMEIDAFGGNTLQINALPTVLELENPREFVAALLDELLHSSSANARFGIDRFAKIYAKRVASLIHVREVEIEPLLLALFSCELPYCAADGRPTLTAMSMAEIQRRFGLNKN